MKILFQQRTTSTNRKSPYKRIDQNEKKKRNERKWDNTPHLVVGQWAQMKATSVIWRPCVRRDNNDDKSGSTTGRSKTDDRPVRVGSWYITPESLHHRRTDRHNKQKLSHAPVLFLLKKYNRASVLVCRFGRLYYCSTAVTPTWPNSFKLSIFSHSDNKRHGDDRRPVLVVFCRMRGHASAWYNWLFLVVYQLLVFPFFFVRCLWLSRFYQNRAPPCNRLTSG